MKCVHGERNGILRGENYFCNAACQHFSIRSISRRPTLRHHSLLRQRPHHALKGYQSHSICRKRSQKAGHETPPIASPSTFSVHSFSCVSPPRKPAFRAERVRHDSLLHDIARVRCDPEDLCGETTGPEVDGWGRQVGVVLEGACEDIIGAPPEAEEGAEEEGRAEPVEDAANAVVFELWNGVSGRARGLLGVLAVFLRQSMGPLYNRLLFSA